ncbi:MAG TPA: hypothetical protein PKM73_15550 [Verrucomicrobiota bacterium]|nr:hypothetical protein [Verrucomicrobiota bacterium]HNU50857.1 hypothetical protein [Verrucomicrobiota bacterium]
MHERPLLSGLAAEPRLTRRHRRWIGPVGLGLAALAVVPLVLMADVLDDFSDPGQTHVPDPARWTKGCYFGPCEHVVADGVVRLAVTPDGEHGFAGLNSVRQWTLREGRTLRLQVDLIGTTGDGAVARLGFNVGNPDKYVLNVDVDTIGLLKREKDPLQLFYLVNGPMVDVTNVKLVLSMTGGPDSSVLVDWKILDNDRAGAVLVSGSHWDTAAMDPMAAGFDVPGRSFAGLTGWLNISVWHDNAGWLDPEVGIPPQGKGEAVFDNPEVLEYDAPVLATQSASMLRWSADTADEQIVAGADRIDGPWAPWPEPVFKRFGELCMAAPTLGAERYFKLVPGSQFADSFDALEEPCATRNPWQLWFLDAGDTDVFRMTQADGVLRIETLMPPVLGQAAVLPTGGGPVLRDFTASVDILEWASDDVSASGLIGRVQGGPGYVSNFYLGTVRMNPALGTGQLFVFKGSGADIPVSAPFSISHDARYRLQFSVVGDELKLRFLQLGESPVLIAEGSEEDTRFSQGRVAMWLNGRNSTTYRRVFDNFHVTGTAP